MEDDRWFGIVIIELRISRIGPPLDAHLLLPTQLFVLPVLDTTRAWAKHPPPPPRSQTMGSARIAIHLALMCPRYSFTAWPAAYSEQMDIGMASEGNKKNEDTDGKTRTSVVGWFSFRQSSFYLASRYGGKSVCHPPHPRHLHHQKKSRKRPSSPISPDRPPVAAPRRSPLPEPVNCKSTTTV
jgi:hypothetical protein